MIYSSGDLFDKCTILDIKLRKGLHVENEFQVVYNEVKELLKKYPKTKAIYKKLFESNLEQYDLEDLIRTEKDLAVVGNIALNIRSHNDARVLLKNKINEITQEAFKEVKDYKRS